MADVKISGLPASTVPLAGTEVLPIVQSGTTKQVSIANVTAGRDIAATSVTTAAVQATNSGGLALKNSSGTTQLSVGAGGGDNVTISVATNITPVNAAVSISPTGTGTVAISPTGALTVNPTAASTINNASIGATTASTGRFTGVTSTDLTASTAVGADANKKLVSLVQPAFSAYMGSGQALSAITNTKLQYNTEVFDTNSNYDPTTNYRFTPTVAGYYQINACYTGASSTSGDFSISISKNGTAVALGGFNSGITGGFTISPTTSVVAYFNGSTDYVEVFAYVQQAQTLQAGVVRSFNGCFLRGA